MESPLQDGFGSQDHFGESPTGSFLSALGEAIATADQVEIAAEGEKQQAIRLGQEDATALKAAEDVMRQFFLNSYSTAFNDQAKIDTIKEFLVRDMGLKTPEKVFETLPRLLEHARNVTSLKLTDLDKLVYLVLMEKARRDNAVVR